MPDASAQSLTGIVAETVEPGAAVFTDEWPSYRELAGLGYYDEMIATPEPAS